MRVGLGMKKHWRKESKYADMAAVAALNAMGYQELSNDGR